MNWSRSCIVSAALLMATSAFADETFVQIQEMVNDIGGPRKIKKNNGKVLKCASGGTKKITIKGGSYHAVYNNCREFGSTRDGERFISVGGDDDFVPEKKERYTGEPAVEDNWNISRSESNNLAVMTSGTVELTVNDDTGRLKDVKGLPALKPFFAEGYKNLNKIFGMNLKPGGKDETVAIIEALKEIYSFDRNAWDFCTGDQENPRQQRNCKMTSYADAASVIVQRYNEGTLEPAIETYLFSEKYLKHSDNLKKGEDFLSLVKWCSYGECNFASDVYTDNENVPSKETIAQSFDYLNYLIWASAHSKVEREPLKENDNLVEGADAPEMYKAAFDFLTAQHAKAKAAIASAKGKKDIVALYNEDKDAATVKWIASKLQSTVGTSEAAGMNLAVHSVYPVQRERWDNKGRQVLRQVSYRAVEEESDKTYKGIMISGKPFIDGSEIKKWVEELESIVLKAEIKDAEQSVAKDPKNVQAWMSLGYNYFYDNQPEKAVAAYETALPMATEASDKLIIMNGIGFVCRNTGAYDKAIQMLEGALKLDDKYLDALYNLGYLYTENLKEPQKGAEYYKRYLALDPSSATAALVRQQLEAPAANYP